MMYYELAPVINTNKKTPYMVSDIDGTMLFAEGFTDSDAKSNKPIPSNLDLAKYEVVSLNIERTCIIDTTYLHITVRLQK